MNRRSMARIKAAAERAAIWVNPLTLQHAARDINTAAALVGMQLTGDVLQQVKTAFGHLAAAATPGAGQGELRQAGAAATRLITNADQYAGSSLPGHALRSRGPGSWAPGKLLSLPDQPAAAPGPHRGLPVHGRVSGGGRADAQRSTSPRATGGSFPARLSLQDGEAAGIGAATRWRKPGRCWPQAGCCCSACSARPRGTLWKSRTGQAGLGNPGRR
jgi:hypothetical protein